MVRLVRRVCSMCAAAAALVWAGWASAEPAVWRIRDADSTIVMFGSVHVLPEGVNWRTAELDRALAEADEVWFELPREAPPGQSGDFAAARQMLARGLLPKEERLSDMVSADTRARLERVAQRIGRRPEDFDRFRPWFAALFLQVMQFQEEGATSEHGVEEVIARSAPANVRFRAFESPDQQIDVFAGLPIAEQVLLLDETLRGMEEGGAEEDRALQAWLRGDLAALADQLMAEMRRDAPNLYRRILVDRNRAWTGQIEQMLQGSGETLVVVGAAHLVGEDSVPAMLRARGIAVEGP